MASETKASCIYGRRLNSQRKRQRAGYLRGRGHRVAEMGKSGKGGGGGNSLTIGMGSALKASIPLHEPMRMRTHKIYWLGPLTEQRSRILCHTRQDRSHLYRSRN